jgi:nucleoid-associated protein YgaU
MYYTVRQDIGSKSCHRRDGTKRKRLRVYSEKRFGLFLLSITIFLMIIAFVAGGFIFGQESIGMEEPVYETLTIKAGDTIWEIAETYAPDTEDIRCLVRAILEENDIKAGEIYPGQVIRVPIKK